MAHEIFISYAAEDKAIADAVCAAIEAHGITCWYAPRDVPYGQDFEESIVDAICTSRLIILILTSHSNTSAHVKREIQNACMEEVSVPVLPFRVEDVPLNKALRYYIGSLHWLDAVTSPLGPHLQLLVEHVRARLPQPVKPLGTEENQLAKEDSVLEIDEPENVANLASEPAGEGTEVEAESGAGKVAQPEETERSEEGSREFADDRAKDEKSSTLIAPEPQVPNYLAPAIGASLLCCLPAGVISIIFAVQANSKGAAGDTEAAIAKSRLARNSLIASIGLGLTLYLFFIVASLLGPLIPRNSGYQPPANQPPANQPSPSVKASPNRPTNGNTATISSSLSGFSVYVFYLSPNKSAAERISQGLKLNGAQVESFQRDDAAVFEAQSGLFYYGERAEDAKKIARALSDIETVQVNSVSSGPTHSGVVQFYLWVGKGSY